MSGLVKNPNIYRGVILGYPARSTQCSSHDTSATREIIERIRSRERYWYYMSSNPNITWDIIRDNLDKSWDWGKLSENLFDGWKK